MSSIKLLLVIVVFTVTGLLGCSAPQQEDKSSESEVATEASELTAKQVATEASDSSAEQAAVASIEEEAFENDVVSTPETPEDDSTWLPPYEREMYEVHLPRLIAIFKSGDKAAIASTVAYPFDPFELNTPIEPIKDETEMLTRFDEVFDDEIIADVASSTSSDWNFMQNDDVMFKNGSIWAYSTGELFRIRAKTPAKEVAFQQALDRVRLTLHPSVREFKEPKLNWTMKRFQIRIDDMGDSGYRYVAWPSSKKQTEKPDIILHGGTVNYDGSAGGHTYEFVNGKYTYSIYVGFHEDDSSGGLFVHKGDENIFSERYFKN